jgi:hypothetical protein
MSNKKKTDEALVVVYTTSSYEEAYVVAGKLESEGIPTVVEGSPGLSGLGIMVPYHVRVQAKHQRRAAVLLGEEDISEW